MIAVTARAVDAYALRPQLFTWIAPDAASYYQNVIDSPPEYCLGDIGRGPEIMRIVSKYYQCFDLRDGIDLPFSVAGIFFAATWRYR